MPIFKGRKHRLPPLSGSSKSHIAVSLWDGKSLLQIYTAQCDPSHPKHTAEWCPQMTWYSTQVGPEKLVREPSFQEQALQKCPGLNFAACTNGKGQAKAGAPGEGKWIWHRALFPSFHYSVLRVCFVWCSSRGLVSDPREHTWGWKGRQRAGQKPTTQAKQLMTVF